MTTRVYTVLGRVAGVRAATAANAANLLAAAGDDVVVLDLQPRTPPPPLCDAEEGLAAVLAGHRSVPAATVTVPTAPTAEDDPVVFGGGVSLLPFTRSLTPVVPPEDDPTEAAARVLDGLTDEFDAVCAVAPPLPDLVGLDRLWVATLNRTAARSDGVVGVVDTSTVERCLESLQSAERGGVRPDCTVAVQPTRSAPPPTTVRDPEYPLRGRVPAPDVWPDAAADAYRECVERLTDSGVADLVDTPPALLTPDEVGDTDRETGRRTVTDGGGSDGRETDTGDDRGDVEWTLNEDRDADDERDGERDREESAGRLRGLFR